jgi:hypothetical protein
MTNPTSIEDIVMRRVRLIRILRLIISTVVLASLTGIVALWGIGREVWVARVFENAPAESGNLFAFYWYAFLHTRFIVQALSVLTLASFIFLAREVARLLFDFFASSRA